MGSIHLRYMTSSLPGSHPTMVNSKGKLLPAVASLITKISTSVQVPLLQMTSCQRECQRRQWWGG